MSRDPLVYGKIKCHITGQYLPTIDIDCMWEGQVLAVFIVERPNYTYDVYAKGKNEVKLTGKSRDTLMDIAEAAQNMARDQFFIDLDAEFRYKE